MDYDPHRRADPPAALRRDDLGTAGGRDTGGLGTRAALALAGVLLVAGVVATSALAGSGAQRSVAAGPGASLAGLVAGLGGASGPPASPARSQESGASDSPSPSADPSGAPTPRPSPSPTPTPTPTAGTPGASIPSGTLQAKLDAVRARLRIPGVTVAILWDDGRQWMGASGLRDVAANEPMTTGTAVALASVSKTLTAAVVLQLVDEGRLKLDAPVAPLLPEYALDKRITLRMLLDHTSGLPDFFLNARHRPPAAAGPGRDLERGRHPPLRAQGARHAGAALDLLQHELPAARGARPARDRASRSPSRSGTGC